MVNIAERRRDRKCENIGLLVLLKMTITNEVSDGDDKWPCWFRSVWTTRLFSALSSVLICDAAE
jgi:hypothetical protein